MNRDMKTLVDYARAKGWEIIEAGKHLQCVSPEGTVVTIPGSPSDWRSFRNTVADLRRAGLDLPRKRQAPKKKLGAVPMLAGVTNDGQIKGGVPAFNPPVYPHITAILGQWRNASWFAEDGSPLRESDWAPFDESWMAQTLMATMLAHNEGSSSSVQSPRNFRITLDAMKFWAVDPDDEDTPFPTRCTCGRDFIVADSATRALAQHIVSHHEKAEYDHAPSEYVYPWTDPDLIEEMLDDSMDAYVAELEAKIRSAEQGRLIYKERYDTLRSKLRELIE